MYVRRVPRQHTEPQKTSQKRKIFLVLLIIVTAYAMFSWLWSSEEAVIENGEITPNIQKEVSEESMINYKIVEGDIPADVFNQQGKFDANDVVALLAAAKDVYDFTKINVGRNIRFYFSIEGARASRMEYDRDTERMIVIERDGEEFNAREEKINYEISQETARGKIENFFYIDAQSAGLSEATTLEVGNIFAFDIDFTTEIQKGDEFIVVYEKRLRDGNPAPDGKILAAKFINQGTPYYAYYFENDGAGGYYDGDGRALERQFLKAPLSFSRISSGYTGARMHPITRVVSAHYQIDYVAPSGTPVVSTARGTVTSAGWENGWGYIVRIKHDNGYTTHYGHLSSFAKGIRAGVRVSQGEVVGFVGSTGWSTGPHLDFGMKLNGAPVNPLKLDLPKGAPLDENRMKEFSELKNKNKL